mmetsp:Transcript_62814/g.72087  ORF Transcript_62814/g.72087 Transcript_62814/m.72087 type:complete len:111 (-) Transcript_62814:502-834(-)
MCFSLFTFGFSTSDFIFSLILSFQDTLERYYPRSLSEKMITFHNQRRYRTISASFFSSRKHVPDETVKILPFEIHELPTETLDNITFSVNRIESISIGIILYINIGLAYP